VRAVGRQRKNRLRDFSKGLRSGRQLQRVTDLKKRDARKIFGTSMRTPLSNPRRSPLLAQKGGK